MNNRPLRVVAIMESIAVSGPAKNLIEFGRRAAEPQDGVPSVQLTLITYARGPADTEFVTAARAAGIRTFQLVERRRWDTRVIPELKRIVMDCTPDIVQSHNIKSHFYVRITGLHHRFPWIVFNHGYTSRDLLDKMYTQVDRWSLRAAHRVVSVCGPFAERLSRRGINPSRIRIQHNSVKPFLPPAAADVEKTLEQLNIGNDLVVLSVGRLSREKGHKDLLTAVSLLLRMDNLPPFRVLIVGDGPEREPLRRLTRALEIDQRVTFTGHKSDVRPYYAIASVLVLPSHTEGSPNVVLEAMAAGIPVVATAVGGVPEIIEDAQTGLIVQPRRPYDMAAATAKMLQDRKLRQDYGAAAQQRVHRDFSPEAYTRSLIAIYQDALNSRARNVGQH